MQLNCSPRRHRLLGVHLLIYSGVAPGCREVWKLVVKHNCHLCRRPLFELVSRRSPPSRRGGGKLSQVTGMETMKSIVPFVEARQETLYYQNSNLEEIPIVSLIHDLPMIEDGAVEYPSPTVQPPASAIQTQSLFLLSKPALLFFFPRAFLQYIEQFCKVEEVWLLFKVLFLYDFTYLSL